MLAKKDVFAYIERNSDELVKWVIEGLSYPSINHLSNPDRGDELEFQKWLNDKLLKNGIKTDMWAEDPGGIRPNVVGILNGSGEGKSLIFNGHCDVMPILRPDKWNTGPFKPVVKNGNIYGRGASDMKGGLLTAFWTAIILKRLGFEPRGDIYLESAIGEENNSGETIGTSAICKKGYKADFAIVVEPTDLELQPCSCGCFDFYITIYGKEAHSSARNLLIFPQHANVECGPAIGVDAMKKAMPIIDLLYNLEQEWNVPSKHYLIGSGGYPIPNKQGLGGVVLNLAVIEGGTILGATMGKVKLSYLIYHPESLKREDIIKEVKERIFHYAQTDGWLKENPPVCDFKGIEWRPCEIPIDHEGVKTLGNSITQATGNSAVFSGFKAVCDTTYLMDHGIPAVVYGPGSLGFGVHGDNEYVPVEHLITAAKVYAAMMMDWCN